MTQEAADALQSAIEAAQAVTDKEDATQNETDAALDELKLAEAQLKKGGLPRGVLTYKLNGGNYNGSTDDVVEEYDAGTVISIPDAPVRDGYTFTYWQGSEYQPGDAYTVEEDHTFTAQWKKNEEPDDGDEADDGEKPDNGDKPDNGKNPDGRKGPDGRRGHSDGKRQVSNKTPVKPDAPQKESSAAAPSEAAKTADTSDVGRWTLLSMAAAFAMILLASFRRRENRR